MEEGSHELLCTMMVWLGMSGVWQPGVYFWAWTCQGYHVSLGIVTAGDERVSPSSLSSGRLQGVPNPL